MTIQDAIDEVTRLWPSDYDGGDMVRWLNRVENQIYNEIILTHEGGGGIERPAFDEDTDWEATVLLAPAPHDELYIYYLEYQIDYNNIETEKASNSMAMFAAAYQAYADWYNRTHRPKTTKPNWF